MTFEEEKLCTGMVLVFIGGCVYNVSIVVLKLKVGSERLEYFIEYNTLSGSKP